MTLTLLLARSAFGLPAFFASAVLSGGLGFLRGNALGLGLPRFSRHAFHGIGLGLEHEREWKANCNFQPFICKTVLR
jgi:hypothetical protein